MKSVRASGFIQKISDTVKYPEVFAKGCRVIKLEDSLLGTVSGGLTEQEKQDRRIRSHATYLNCIWSATFSAVCIPLLINAGIDIANAISLLCKGEPLLRCGNMWRNFAILDIQQRLPQLNPESEEESQNEQ